MVERLESIISSWGEHQGWSWSFLVAQGVKDLALSLLLLRFDHWPQNFHILREWPKKKKKQKEQGGLVKKDRCIAYTNISRYTQHQVNINRTNNWVNTNRNETTIVSKYQKICTEKFKAGNISGFQFCMKVFKNSSFISILHFYPKKLWDIL